MSSTCRFPSPGTPFETQLIHGYNYREVEGRNYELYKWNGCYFPVYCCYELASISERALFQSYADYLVAVEWNHDTKYFSNIMESLSRDLHCYCIQVNTSDYGDSRITMPAKSETMNCVQTKGGDNSTVLIGEIDIDKLRKFQIKEYEPQTKDTTFKPTPPEFDKHKVMDKIQESSLIIPPLGTHRSAIRKTVIRIKERTNPKRGTHQSAQGTHLPLRS